MSVVRKHELVRDVLDISRPGDDDNDEFGCSLLSSTSSNRKMIWGGLGIAFVLAATSLVACEADSAPAARHTSIMDLTK